MELHSRCDSVANDENIAYRIDGDNDTNDVVLDEDSKIRKDRRRVGRHHVGRRGCRTENIVDRIMIRLALCRTEIFIKQED